MSGSGFFRGVDGPRDRERAAAGLLARSRMLAARGDQGAVVAVLDELLARFGTDPDDPEASVLPFVAAAALSKPPALRALGRDEDALAAWDEALVRFAGEAWAGNAYVTALDGKANTLGGLGRVAEAVAVWDELLAQFRGSAALDMVPVLPHALAGRAHALRLLGRFEEALSTAAELLARFGGASDPAVCVAVAGGMWERVGARVETGRDDLALAACEELIKRFSSETDTAILVFLARAMVQAGVLLEVMRKAQRASAAYLEVLERFGDAPEDALHGPVAFARVNAATLLAGTHDSATLIAALERESGIQLALTARALVYRADARSGSPHAMLELVEPVIDALDGRDEPELRKVTALALSTKSVALAQLGDADPWGLFEEMVSRLDSDALAAFNDEERGFSQREGPQASGRRAWAMLNQGRILESLGRETDSRATLQSLITTFDSDHSPEVRTTIAVAEQALKRLDGHDPE